MRICDLMCLLFAIQDISELEKLEVLPSLIELSVVGNPVSHKHTHNSLDEETSN